jgi:uncharacterized membrane protein
MAFIQQPVYVLAVLFLVILLAEWLAGKKYFRQVGVVIITILFSAILANLGIIPSSHNATPLYEGIFVYIAPLAIFFLLLEVKLSDLRFAGLPMVVMFLAGTLATVAAVLFSYWLWSPQNHQVNQAYAIAGMYTGTYIGGSINLNAIALHYQVNKDGTLFAAVNAVDNLVGTLWILATILLPPVLRKWMPRKKNVPPGLTHMSDEELRAMTLKLHADMNLVDIGVLLALGFGTLFIASEISSRFPGIPSIIVVTTLALIFAQLPFIQKRKGAKLIGMSLVLLFLAVVGAYCDLRAVADSGSSAFTLVLWVASIILIHGLIIFTLGGVFKQDWDLVSVASNANIGGSTSAPVCAAALGRPDLQLPGLLAGSLGNAIGTYIGLLVAEFLK